jgi:histone-lysine N-methyltransferase SETMAR
MPFWEINGPILEHYMSKGTTITRSSYCDLLVNHLKPAIRSKHRGLLTTGVLLLHDNAWPHTAHATVAKIKDLHFQCLPHPPYSPDLEPSDFHVFGALEGELSGRKFRSDEVQEAVHNWLCKQPKDFFLKSDLVKRWNKCIESNGNYVEK